MGDGLPRNTTIATTTTTTTATPAAAHHRTADRDRLEGGTASSYLCEVPLQATDHAGERVRERLELVLRHRGEERPSECLVVALELVDERLALLREGHEGRSPVAWVRLARHELLCDECIDEAGHGSRRDLQRVREHPLEHRAALSQLPEEVRSSRGEAERGVCTRHVVVEHDHQIEDAIEEILILL